MRNLREYLWPGSPEDALRLLRERPGRGSLLAGGTWLAERHDPELDFVVDISRLGLERVDCRDGELRIGATISLQSLLEHPALQNLAQGTLARAIQRTRTEAWRRQATLAGRLLTADPADRLLPVLLVQEAVAHVLSATGPQTMALQNALQPTSQDRIWLGLGIPEAPTDLYFALESLSKSQLDTPVATVAVAVRCHDGRIAEARISTNGVGSGCARCPHVEQLLIGMSQSCETFATPQDALAAEVQPIGDLRASSDYREHLTRTLFARALRRALHAPQGEDDAPTA